MAENNIDAAVIKRTQEMLGKYVKKPSLSEKLLRKPPFRFLHDVFNVVIKDTGYFVGLYTTDELNYENIKDRDDKMRFLQKMIDVIKIIMKSDINIRTSKIVAGQEPERTNQLLQFIGEVITKQMDWKAAVATVATSSTKAENSKNIKTNTQKQSENKRKDKPTQQKPTIKDKETKPTKLASAQMEMKSSNKTNHDSKSKKSLKTRDNEKTKTKNEKQSQTKDKNNKVSKTDGVKVKQESESAKIIAEDETNEKKLQSPINRKESTASDVLNVENPPHVNGSESALEREIVASDQPVATPTTAEVNHIINDNHEVSASEENEVLKHGDDANKYSPAKRRKSSSGKNSRASANKNKSKIEHEHSESAESKNLESLNVTKEKRIVTQPTKEPSQNDMKRESTFTREHSKENDTASVTRPRTSLRPPSARPASARPGAPRRRDKNVEIILQPNDQIKMSGIEVKLETFGDFDDDGENLVIIEDPSIIEHMVSDESSYTRNASELQDNVEQQGHLVQQILETQKELVQQNNDKATVNNDRDGGDAKSIGRTLNGRQSSARQMNNLRDVIQNLTKSVNPFGKLMDFIPEDMDAMQLEMTMWRDTYTQATNELKREKCLTDSVTEPMKNQLEQIEANINEYQDMIDVSRAKILHNTERIMKMLTD